MPCITIDSDRLDAFRDSFPCHNLDDVLSVVVDLDSEGNLDDLEVYVEDADGEPVLDFDHDRAGLVEIVADVQEEFRIDNRPHGCGCCGGECAVLGVLGDLQHLRCRNCGAQFSRPV